MLQSQTDPRPRSADTLTRSWIRMSSLISDFFASGRTSSISGRYCSGHDIPCFLRNTKFQHHFHKIACLTPSSANLIPTFTLCFLKIHFSNILWPAPGCRTSWSSGNAPSRYSMVLASNIWLETGYPGKFLRFSLFL
jgi:hypothetical protein